jgi:hypothetical protein
MASVAVAILPQSGITRQGEMYERVRGIAPLSRCKRDLRADVDSTRYTLNWYIGILCSTIHYMEIAYSINGVPIRLTDERWEHIVSNKPYMDAYEDTILEAVEQPLVVLRGYAGALIAVRSLARHRYLHVVYKEVNQEDGFIVTAYVSRKYNRNQVIWPRRS